MEDIFTCPTWVSKPQWVLPYLHYGGECNVHTPLVLYVASIWMVSIVGKQFKMAAQLCYLCVHSPNLALELNPGQLPVDREFNIDANQCGRDKSIVALGMLNLSQLARMDQFKL